MKTKIKKIIEDLDLRWKELNWTDAHGTEESFIEIIQTGLQNILTIEEIEPEIQKLIDSEKSITTLLDNKDKITTTLEELQNQQDMSTAYNANLSYYGKEYTTQVWQRYIDRLKVLSMKAPEKYREQAQEIITEWEKENIQ